MDRVGAIAPTLSIWSLPALIVVMAFRFETANERWDWYRRTLTPEERYAELHGLGGEEEGSPDWTPEEAAAAHARLDAYLKANPDAAEQTKKLVEEEENRQRGIAWQSRIPQYRDL